MQRVQQRGNALTAALVCPATKTTGEHSDWAADLQDEGWHSSRHPGGREGDADRGGYALVVLTTDSLYIEASATSRSDGILCVVPHDDRESLSIPMDAATLKAKARLGEFNSMIAGAAQAIMTYAEERGDARIAGGADVRITECTLPISKGLSSSAAICVLIVRALCVAHGLPLSTSEEMECAYRGERLTPSRCGRLDQVVAWGTKTTACSIRFLPNEARVEPVHVCSDADIGGGRALNLLLVDLLGLKDTPRILQDLQLNYREAVREGHTEGIVRCLHRANNEAVSRCLESLRQSRNVSVEIGREMKLAQERFDAHLAPQCPSELQAPRLRSVLSLVSTDGVREHVCGAKSVGAGGDGMCLVLARDAGSSLVISEAIKRNLGYDCIHLSVRL